jgi:hypothetical protein
VKVVGLVILASLCAASPAFAEPPGLTSPVPSYTSEPTEMQTFGGKSETVATGLTLAGIAGPMILFGSALADIENDDGGATVLTGFLTIGGPAIGHWYTNHVGTYGMIARIAAMGFVGSGYSEYATIEGCKKGTVATFYCSDLSVGSARTKATLGFAIYGASWIYDLVTSRREVRRYNAKRTFPVVPSITVTGNGAAATLAGSF